LLPFLFGLLALYLGLLLLFNGLANFKATSLFSIFPSTFSVGNAKLDNHRGRFNILASIFPSAYSIGENAIIDRQRKFNIFMHYYPHILDELELFTYWEQRGVPNFEEIYRSRGLGGKTKTAYDLIAKHTESNLDI